MSPVTETFGRRARWVASASAALFAGAWLLGACEGDTGPPGPPAPPAPSPPPPPAPAADTELARGEDPPGVRVAILGLSGASGSAEAFQVGDSVSVTFTLERADGSAWALEEMTHARAMVAGPTFNYQRVVAEQTDVAAASVKNADGSFTYTFANALPASYLPPYNDTSAFGPLDGELAGQALLSGTYTVGLSFVWSYTVEGAGFVDVGEASRDFLFGSAATLLPRQVVSAENCNQCHVELTAHRGTRRELVQCLMCHTAGAEDPNDPALAGGTPGFTINSRVLMHKIHNAAHLPSVLGVATHPSGLRDYFADPAPLLVADGIGEVRDFSDVGFPVWPNRTIPMPKDFGYSGLPPAAQAQEDAILTGITSCHVCHGDPDGAGPLEGPADGAVVFAQPSRAACGACHDDVNFAFPYTANGTTMAPQPDDSTCTGCHEVETGALSVVVAHRHPLHEPFYNPGLAFELISLAEAGMHDRDGSIDAGERLEITFRITDASGAEVAASELDAIRVVVSGPTANSQILLSAEIPTAALSGPQPYSITVPERRLLEFVGDSSAETGDVFSTAVAPHLNVAGAPTTVQVRSATAGGSTALSTPTRAPQNFLDVLDSVGFERDDVIVVDDGVPGREEYLRIQFVQGDRLWFSSTGDTFYPSSTHANHAAGASVREIALTELVEGRDYVLDPLAGEITELVELGPGNAVVVSYTSDFVMPESYPVPLNDSPLLDGSSGEWSGKELVAGTYSLGLWGHIDVIVVFAGEQNPYRISSTAASIAFPGQDPAAVEPYALISSGANCLACHQELLFHGGSHRGFDACILCHGTSGAEDRPKYVAANAPATPGVTVGFRTLLHRIHMGKQLANAADFVVVGEGEEPYPDNFELSTFDHILFPAQPGGVLQCAKCHGADNLAWLAPAPREHPIMPNPPVRAWNAVCGACHDSPAAAAHIAAQTAPNGSESCAICHGVGEQWNVELYHDAR